MTAEIRNLASQGVAARASASPSMRTLVYLALAALLAAAVSGCGGAASPSAVAQSPAPGSTASSDTASGGGTAGNQGLGTSEARGFDCAVVLPPEELDAASGKAGGTITTVSRGDQNPESPGYGECNFEEPSLGTWFGHVSLATGAALESFGDAFAFARSNGGTSVAGLGSEALQRSDGEGAISILAKSQDGVGVVVGLAFDPEETSGESAQAAVIHLLKTVLKRV